jgi:carbamoylphosphate synthase large subunit
LTIDDILYLNTQHYKILNNAIPIPKKESVLLCDDKDAFNNFLISNGFSDYIPTTGLKLRFPYILKKKVDVWGANSFIIDNKNKELEFEDKINNISEYFTQELILGKTEYATHILFKGNRIVYSLNVKYTFANEMPIKGKDKPLFMTIIGSYYLDLFSTILELINFEGLCCFNYKIVDGKPLIFEINPRFGGSLCPFFFIFLDHIKTKKPT